MDANVVRIVMKSIIAMMPIIPLVLYFAVDYKVLGGIPTSIEEGKIHDRHLAIYHACVYLLAASVLTLVGLGLYLSYGLN